MANKPAEKVGRGPCPQCGEAVTFKRSAGGLLNFACDVCDCSGYSRPGGTAYAKWQASITVTHHGNAAAAPAPAATPAPTPAAAPAKPKAAPKPPPAPTPAATAAPRKGFSLDDL